MHLIEVEESGEVGGLGIPHASKGDGSILEAVARADLDCVGIGPVGWGVLAALEEDFGL